MKKQFYTAMMIAAGTLVPTASSVYAQDSGSSNTEKSLAPLIMVVFDTSGSMDLIVEKKNGNGVVDVKNNNDARASCNCSTSTSTTQCDEFDYNTCVAWSCPNCAQYQCKEYYGSGYKTYCTERNGKCAQRDNNYNQEDYQCYSPDWNHKTCKTCAVESTCTAWQCTQYAQTFSCSMGNSGICSSGDKYTSDGSTHEFATHTRLTKAVAEIAGTPKRPTDINYNRLIKANSAVFPRRTYSCDTTGCSYKLDKYEPNASTYYAVSKLYINDTTCQDNLRTHYSQSCLDDYENAYLNDGVLQGYQKSVKFGFAGMAGYSCSNDEQYSTLKNAHMYGYGTNTNPGDTIQYGRDLTSNYYKQKCKSSKYDSGMWNNDKNAKAPLMYPTVSDDQQMIINSNQAVIDGIRSYYPTANTPIGPVLADMFFMFGADAASATNPADRDFTTKADKGMFKQHKTQTEIIQDDYYNCRPKAVILITDGEPVAKNAYNGSSNGTYNDNVHGHMYKVWNDAAHLYKAGIKVYAVGYAFSDNDMNPSASKEAGANLNPAVVLNNIAFQGGTCRNPANGRILKPNEDDDVFEDMIAPGTGKSLKDRICYFNATDNAALRSALVTALSDMLASTVSKTKLATTSAISMKHNVETSTTGTYTYNNGYYNVYSGYDITLGQLRKTYLQREAITCNHSTGNFAINNNQYLDLSQRLVCQITDCKSWVMDENNQLVLQNDTNMLRKAGYNSTPPTPCAPHGSNEGNFTENSNTCLYQRYIFAGDYSDNRYKLQPKNVSLTAQKDGHYLAGYIPNARGANQTASFLTQKEGSNTCNDAKNSYIFTNYTYNVNYMLSPYECADSLDCGLYDNRPRQCDAGRCVNYDKYQEMESCTSNSVPHYAGINAPATACIAGRMRTIGTECDQHSDCGEGEVCHAGYCLAGTVPGCDIRQFIATQRLGTIEYATPVPVNPPTRQYPSSEYRAFSKTYWQRDTMLLVGANDGMLHAFILGDNTVPESTNGSQGYTTGQYEADSSIIPQASATSTSVTKRSFSEGDELWAFIPKSVMPNIQNLTNFGPQSMVNATPVVSEVITPSLYHFSDGTTADSRWRTVVVGGLGDGGRGYYALDITNPGQPKILWEIDHQWQAATTPTEYPDMLDDPDLTVSLQEDLTNRKRLELGSTEPTYPFQLLGYNTPEPVITNVLIHKSTGDVIEPVAILAGGRNGSNNSAADRTGKALYIVRLYPETPQDLLVKAFYFEHEVTGTPAIYPNTFNSVAQYIYVGDANSALYRLDIGTYMTSATAWHSVAQWGSDSKRTMTQTVEIDDPAHEGQTLNLAVQYERPIFEPARMDVMGGTTDIADGTPTSPSPYNKITYKPAISLYKAGEKPTLQITFGTGSNDNFNITNSEHNYVANFYDVYTSDHYQLNAESFTAAKPLVLVFNPPNNIQQRLNGEAVNGQKFNIYTSDPLTGVQFDNNFKRQKMSGAAITYNFVSYFPTFIASNDEAKAQCVTGNAAIWKIGDIAGSGNVRDHRIFTTTTTNVQNASEDALFNGKSYYNLHDGTKVYGLEITNQMFCRNDANPNASKISAPQLIAQTGGIATAKTGSSASSIDPSNTDLKSFSINLNAFKPNPQKLSWASVYE